MEPLRVGASVELRIERLVTGGEGLARHGGRPVFVPLTAPGDRLVARITESRKGHARGVLVTLLEAGTGRRAAPCRHFADCGGCDLQHLDEATQLALKVAATRETLRRLGGVELPEPEIVEGAPWGYRLRAQLFVTEGRLAYRARGSHRLVPIENCPILDPALQACWPALARDAHAQGLRRVAITAGTDGCSATPPSAALPLAAVRRRVGEHEFAYDAKVFFQAHGGLLEALAERAVGGWRGQCALDLFAGVGFFSLPLARRYQRVLAVESQSEAMQFLRQNIAHNGAEQVEVLGADLEAAGQPEDLADWSAVDRVLVDPPRSGLPPELRRALLSAGVARLSYVSCDPATLARDLRELTAVYAVESWTLLDLFPQTGHIEAVVQLVPRR
ncbi:MAG: class I SAM-dependent RNA methyltransferase [Planctomycetota bacterium]